MKKAVREFSATTSTSRSGSELADGMRYVATDFADDDGGTASSMRCASSTSSAAARQPLYYLAVPPAAFETIVDELGERRAPRGGSR